jgi:hypothetical protein
MLCVLLLLLLMLIVVVLKLLLMLLGASGDVGVLIGQDTYSVGGEFVVNGTVVFAYNIDAEFPLDSSDEHTGGRLDIQLCHFIPIRKIRSQDLLG